ncbi:hypothetical protein QBC47DRAFT_395601 [Echria macrotheca]|uniref:Uncharacterized protein n=1 Tax=Echria macrotheca TaxID=438768 RepID=A0AAJ0B0S6_9PEZI|nr:hypothetical protein QBC47DRAFT_395601 [Echria macrotheca]
MARVDKSALSHRSSGKRAGLRQKPKPSLYASSLYRKSPLDEKRRQKPGPTPPGRGTTGRRSHPPTQTPAPSRSLGDILGDLEKHLPTQIEGRDKENRWPWTTQTVTVAKPKPKTKPAAVGQVKPKPKPPVKIPESVQEIGFPWPGDNGWPKTVESKQAITIAACHADAARQKTITSFLDVLQGQPDARARTALAQQKLDFACRLFAFDITADVWLASKRGDRDKKSFCELMWKLEWCRIGELVQGSLHVVKEAKEGEENWSQVVKSIVQDCNEALAKIVGEGQLEIVQWQAFGYLARTIIQKFGQDGVLQVGLEDVQG